TASRARVSQGVRQVFGSCRPGGHLTKPLISSGKPLYGAVRVRQQGLLCWLERVNDRRGRPPTTTPASTAARPGSHTRPLGGASAATIAGGTIMPKGAFSHPSFDKPGHH